ncbi:uncharacterized protein LOC126789346 [Argentina anserina]|uniref:uncharacterized protein LOC126789346 n=1 Tax=Argentina anserina TaxID=57926 RepID=UPI00217684B9|nr:uncharacterized protein LOC126789346 [Potentilla anserina]
MIHRMNLTHCFTLSSNLQNEVAKMKKNLPDDSVLTALFSLLFSCWQSEYQVNLPARDDIPEWFTCRMHVTKKGLQECNFRIDFPGNFKWEDKGLAFCASTDVHRAFRHPLRIYINGVTMIEASDVPWNHKPRYYMPCYDIKIVQLYYMPFHDIIKRLGESDLQPPSICLVKFEFKLDSMDEDGMLGSLGVHVVMPGWEGPSVNGVLSQGTDSYSEDNAEA